MRPNAYTEDEDRIILDTTGMGPDETNARLVAAGFQERTGGAIKQRRHHLRSQAGLAGLGEVDALTKAMAHRRQLTDELDVVVKRRREIEDEIRQINAEIHRLLDDLKAEVENAEAS